MPTHIMVDIETLGTKRDAPILTIGAVVFDPKSSGTSEQWYRAIDVKCYDKYHHFFQMSYETLLLWWLKQNEEPRKEAFFPAESVDVHVALKEFAQFVNKHPKPIHMWSHGKEFDLPILEHAMSNFDIPPPWKYWDTRDTRTIFSFMGVKMEVASGSEHHHALCDCLRQIAAFQQCYDYLSYRV